MDEIFGIVIIVFVIAGYFLFSFFALIVLLSRTRDMNIKLDLLQKKLYDLGKSGIKTEITSTPVKTMESFRQEIQNPTPPVTPPAPATPVADPVLRSAPEIPKIFPVPAKEEMAKPITAASTIPQARPVTPPRPPQPAAPKKPGFWESNPDLEKFIGENLINKIGIAILVIGIGFFVKFAIDQNWINEYGRVAIGILCGGILIGTAHYLRKTYKAFSSVLVGGGIATFYFTITLAFQLYHIFPQTVAFVIMVIITIFAVLLSIAYDRKELAVLAIIGGFSSPLLLSTGEGNYKILFTYIAILNIGMLILAYFKRWNIINIVSFIFTIILFGGWMGNALTKNTPFPYLGALIFATLFYLIFFLMNIINNLKNNKQFVAFEFSLLLANTVAYYSAGMFILKSLNEGLYQGLFTVLLALFNFLFAFTLFRSKKVDSNVIYLLIGLVMTFVSLAAPIQLHGNYITLFWAAEAALLLWLSQKSGIKLMKLGSVLINLLMMISLIMDWNNVYMLAETQQDVFLNKAFLTTLTVIASLFITNRLLKSEDDQLSIGVNKNMYQSFLSIALGLFAYFGGVFELFYQLISRLSEKGHIEDILIVDFLLYTVAFTIVLQALMLALKKTKGLILPVILSLALTLLYIFLGYSSVSELRDARLGVMPFEGIHYILHYPLAILFTLMIILNLKLINRKNPDGVLLNQYLWIFCGSVLFVLSTELEHLIVWSRTTNLDQIYEVKHQVFKVGFPILWGLAGFAAMIVGMIKKIKTLRVISLVIFGVTLLKIAIFDIKEMSAGGKIAAFILLGVLLLIISYLYQRTEKKLKEEEAKSKNDTTE